MLKNFLIFCEFLLPGLFLFKKLSSKLALSGASAWSSFRSKPRNQLLDNVSLTSCACEE